MAESSRSLPSIVLPDLLVLHATASTWAVAELEWPVIRKVVARYKVMGAHTILAWIPPGNMESYEGLQLKAESEGIAFNDWYPGVTSTLKATPSMPLSNPHSGGHFRGWVAGMIARGLLREMTLPPH